ncbi:MAG: hypothetical protein ACQGVC_21555 [Myxococcota bacterium]
MLPRTRAVLAAQLVLQLSLLTIASEGAAGPFDPRDWKESEIDGILVDIDDIRKDVSRRPFTARNNAAEILDYIQDEDFKDFDTWVDLLLFLSQSDGHFFGKEALTLIVEAGGAVTEELRAMHRDYMAFLAPDDCGPTSECGALRAEVGMQIDAIEELTQRLAVLDDRIVVPQLAGAARLDLVHPILLFGLRERADSVLQLRTRVDEVLDLLPTDPDLLREVFDPAYDVAPDPSARIVEVQAEFLEVQRLGDDDPDRRDRPRRDRAGRLVMADVKSCQARLRRSLPKLLTNLRRLFSLQEEYLNFIIEWVPDKVKVDAQVGAEGGGSVGIQGDVGADAGGGVEVPNPAVAILKNVRTAIQILKRLADQRLAGFHSCASLIRGLRSQVDGMMSSCNANVGLLLNEDVRDFMHTYIRGLEFEARLQGFDTRSSVIASGRGRRDFEAGFLQRGFQGYCDAYDLLLSPCSNRRSDGKCRF